MARLNHLEPTTESATIAKNKDTLLGIAPIVSFPNY